MISLFVFTGPSFISWFHGESLEVEATCEGFSKGCKNFPQPKARMRTSWGKHSREKKSRKKTSKLNKINTSSAVSVTYLAHDVSFIKSTVFGDNKRQPPSTMTKLDLLLHSAPLLKNCRQEISLSPCLSKPRDAIIRALSPSLPPSPGCVLCRGWTNKTRILALRTSVAWKDKPCLNSQEQNPTLTFIPTFST